MSAPTEQVARLRARVEQWLAALEEAEAPPEGLASDEALAEVPVPDLYAVAAALAALTQEVRLSSRAFAKVTDAVREGAEERERRTAEERRTRTALHGLSQEALAAARREGRREAFDLVFDLHDRLERHARALDAARPRGWFRARARARHAALVEGLALVVRGTREELSRAGLSSVGELGEPFDPTTMQAVRREPVREPERDGCVIEVLRRGWRAGEDVWRPAEVVVGRSVAP